MRIRAGSKVTLVYPSSELARARGAPDEYRVEIGPDWTELHQDVAEYVKNALPEAEQVEIEAI